MKKRKTAFLMAVIILAVAVVPLTSVSYAADIMTIDSATGGLTFDTTSLPSGTYGEPYSYQLKASGGSGDYTFYMSRGTLPTGLRLSSDGTISGTPTKAGGFNTLVFGVRDSEGNSITKRIRLIIEVLDVSFTVTDNYHDYDGTYHTATVTSSVEDFKEGVNYKVTYGGEEAQMIPGSYDIAVQMLTSGYRVLSISPSRFVIYTNENSAISLEDKTVEYDGQQHALVPVVTPSSLEHTVKYVGINGTSYPETTVSPSAAGTYAVTATTTNEYYTQRTATATLRITAPDAVFAVSGPAVATYDGSSHKAEVVALSEGFVPESFNVYYNDTSTPEDERLESVTDAGRYSIIVEFDSMANYRVSILTPEFVVEPKTVNMAVSDNYIEEKAGLSESWAATVQPVSEDAFGLDDYKVIYTKDGKEYPDMVTEAGVYAITVISTNDNYVIGDVTPNTFTVVIIEPNPLTITLGAGNSIGARIFADTGSTAGVEEFKVSRVYRGVTYSALALTGQDLDAEIEAYFVTSERAIGKTGTELGLGDLAYSATYKSGEDATDSVAVTIEGKSVDEWAPLANGVYEMKYEAYNAYDDVTVTAIRNVVVLASYLGDANSDRNVNVADANYITNIVLDNQDMLASQEAATRLYLLRVCDVDHDGDVDAEDGRAIMYRYRNPIVKYYEW